VVNNLLIASYMIMQELEVDDEIPEGYLVADDPILQYLSINPDVKSEDFVVRGHSGSPYTAPTLLTSLPVVFRPAAHFCGLLN